MFMVFKTDYFDYWFLCKRDLRFYKLYDRKTYGNYQNQTPVNLKNDFKGTVVNRALPSLHGRSLEITPQFLEVTVFILFRFPILCYQWLSLKVGIFEINQFWRRLYMLAAHRLLQDWLRYIVYIRSAGCSKNR